MKNTRTVLALETSCDETAASVISGVYNSQGILQELTVHTHVVESQIAIHLPFGGVVPEVAARDHLVKIDEVVARALAGAPEPTLVAATAGPGLIGALMVGYLYAQGYALAKNLPLLAINHVDAHLAPALLVDKLEIGIPVKTRIPTFPALGLTVSGGHCHVSLLTSLQQRTVLGRTSDDACGEAFDKIAKLLGQTYPGGPHIERMAALVNKSQFMFPSSIANKENRLNFSFSGLKTAVLMAVRKLEGIKQGRVSGAHLPEEIKSDLAWAFQEAALGQLIDRLNNALSDSPVPINALFVAGGVAANQRFRQKLATLGLDTFIAPLALCNDNATMIGMHALLYSEAHHLKTRNGFKVQPFTRYADDEKTFSS